MEEIILLPIASNKINSLAEALFRKNYFSFLENANEYVNAINDFISTIPRQKQFLTKRPKIGRYYAKYKPNRRTTYYITFDTNGVTYLIKNIITNHTPDYPRYIGRNK